jgi:apolipoprotein N-acyltransferase
MVRSLAALHFILLIQEACIMKNTTPISRTSEDPLPYPIRDRLSFLWLLLAAGILLFSNGLQIIPIATWIGPAFLLRFIRTQKAWLGLLLGYIASTLTFILAWRPAFLDAGEMFTLYSLAFALIFFIPYGIDRLVKPRIPGFAGTLILPLAFVTTEYLIHMASPLGTFFLLPYTQSSNLPLLQILCITGMWSITFLIAWFASVVNYTWEGGFDPRRIGKGAAVYALILFAVLFFGGMRLALNRPSGSTVQVSVLTTNVDKEVIPEPDSPAEKRLTGGTLTEADRQQMTQTMNEINADLLARTRQQAKAGSKIITWNEYNAHTWVDTETQFLEQAKLVAREQGIYLVFPFIVIEPDITKRPAPEIVDINKSVMITPQGEIAYQYVKHNLLIGYESEHTLRGPQVINAIETPYGKLSSVICLDMEYPDFNRLAGQQGVDIMLSGAIDGTPSTHGNPLHSTMASYRAIEEGFSLARGGFYGANIAVDYQGNLLGIANHYTAGDRTVTAHLPVKGAKTLYTVLGDFFPWTCMLVLGLMVVVTIGKGLFRLPRVAQANHPATSRSTERNS